MKSHLKLLHLEDDLNDASLIQMVMEQGGIACTIKVVQDRESFLSVLQEGDVDLILSDYSLPSFDGLSALKVAEASWPGIPLIIVSGTLGEEMAVDALKNGATDYIVKDRLARLVPAVRRAMHEVEEREARRRLEKQFIESQKMEAIGQLAGGVAHDFNNILAVIMGCGEWISSELVPDSPLRKYTDEIRGATKRAAGLTQQLLLFSRKDSAEPVVLDPNDVIGDMDTMLRRLIGANIELAIIPGKNAGRIKADSGYVGQVLLNLVINARDAMPGGGKLTIAISNVALSESHTRSHLGALPGNYVMLSVQDNGTGITDEVKAHLFEAFFTTKPKGKGTGLGLATCQAIVQRLGGHIGVASELGKGTTFKVYFPRVDQPAPVAPQPVKAVSLPHGTETLLVVEDDSSVKSLACDVLKALGYEVLSAANGQDGLRVAREHQGAPISLVITDVVMPVMSGRVMAEWLKTTYPDLKILFTSGYSEDAVIHQAVPEVGVGFLPKPYMPAVLANKVREMLDTALVEMKSS